MSWITVTFITKPEPEKQLLAFYKRIQPGGWWSPIIKDFQHTLPPVTRGIFIQWISGVMMIYGFTFGIGNLIFNQYSNAILLFGCALIGLYLIWNKNLSHLN